MRWNSLVSCAPTERIASSSPFSVPTRLDRLHDFDGRRLQLGAQILERRALLAQRFDGGLVLERLRRQLIDRQPMLLQLAVGRGDLFGDPLRLVDLIEHAGDALLDLLEALGAILVAADLLAELVELLQRGVGLLTDLFERLAGLRQLRRAAGHLREHGAQRGALLARLGHERPAARRLLFLFAELLPKSASSMVREL